MGMIRPLLLSEFNVDAPLTDVGSSFDSVFISHELAQMHKAANVCVSSLHAVYNSLPKWTFVPSRKSI